MGKTARVWLLVMVVASVAMGVRWQGGGATL